MVGIGLAHGILIGSVIRPVGDRRQYSVYATMSPIVHISSGGAGPPEKASPGGPSPSAPTLGGNADGDRRSANVTVITGIASAAPPDLVLGVHARYGLVVAGIDRLVRPYLALRYF